MDYPKLDFRSFRLSWRGLALVGVVIAVAAAFPPALLVILPAHIVVNWGRNRSKYGNPRISVESVLGLAIGAFAITIAYFYHLDNLRHQARQAPFLKAQHDKFAAVLCPEYFGKNIVQKFNSNRSWCRDYPQFDRSHAAKVAKIDAEPTAAVSSATLWK